MMKGRDVALGVATGAVAAIVGYVGYEMLKGGPPGAVAPSSVGTRDGVPAGELSTPPTQSTDLKVTAATYNRVDLQWQDNASTETGFKIYRTTDIDKDGTRDANEPWVLLADRPPNTTNNKPAVRKIYWSAEDFVTWHEVQRRNWQTGALDATYGVRRIELTESCNPWKSTLRCEWEVPDKQWWYEVRACSTGGCSGWTSEPKVSCSQVGGQGCPCDIYPALPECQ